MTDKLVSALLENMSKTELFALTEKLYARAKVQAQTGFDTNGEPVTQESFATLNEVRRQLETARKRVLK
jgi:hypothetical protein